MDILLKKMVKHFQPGFVPHLLFRGVLSVKSYIVFVTTNRKHSFGILRLSRYCERISVEGSDV